MAHPSPAVMPLRRRRDLLLIVALAAFLLANLIHNNLKLDVAVFPAAILSVLYWRRPRRGLLIAAAVTIALPAFFFLKWGTLIEPPNTKFLINHVSLLLAGTGSGRSEK